MTTTYIRDEKESDKGTDKENVTESDEKDKVTTGLHSAEAEAEAEADTSSGEDEPFDVTVLVYDLSRGMAAQYSPMILGINLDAIYHTSVVVYGKEYFINQGIQINLNPGNTKYGIPMEIIDKGKTFITEDIFNEFLDDLRNHDENKYHAINYDLFSNNCNHFTDVLLDFLVGDNLDKRILSLPEQVLNTPNGQLLRQLIGNGNELI